MNIFKIETRLSYIENPYRLSELSPRRYSNINATLCDGTIITTITNPLPYTEYYYVQYTPIVEYKISPIISHNFNNRFNTSITYKGKYNDYQIFCKLNFWQKQKFKVMMGDHILLKDGNFRWLITAFILPMAIIVLKKILD